MPENQITIFAETNFRNQRQRFGIKQDDRRRHMYLIGKTGMGKSVLQENMIIEDIEAGKGIAVVDPHGDLAEKIIKYIPSNRVNDVIYFNPADIEHPIAFNVVERVDPRYRHLVASGLVGIFQKLWADSWGPRLEYILRNAILAILDYPSSTLMGITRMLADKAFRKKVIEKIQDPVVKSFWINEFAGYADKFASEAVAPIQNKVGQFLSSSLIRNIVGQVKSSIELRSIMDEGKILILNLSKGHIGEDNSSLLGAMMITKIQLAAMSRVDTPEEQRKDFYLYVDEFQNFATESFCNILSEARKYRLNLVMAHQYIEQLGEKVWAAVQGNVGTLIVFRVGATDAEVLVKEFSPQYVEEDLVNLPKYNFYIKLMIDGIASDPFSATGLPPKSESEETGDEEKVKKVSRERYASKRALVEEKILRWHGMGDEEVRELALPLERSGTVRGERKFSAKCDRCGKDIRVPFKPDKTRPVYCDDCLSLVRSEERGEKRTTEQKPNIKEMEDVPIKGSENQGISLGEALKRGPVDFRGRGVRRREPANQPRRPSGRFGVEEKAGPRPRDREERGVNPSSAKVGVETRGFDRYIDGDKNGVRNGRLEEGKMVKI